MYGHRDKPSDSDTASESKARIECQKVRAAEQINSQAIITRKSPMANISHDWSVLGFRVL